MDDKFSLEELGETLLKQKFNNQDFISSSDSESNKNSSVHVLPGEDFQKTQTNQLIEKIIYEFNLPQDTNKDNLISALRQKFSDLYPTGQSDSSARLNELIIENRKLKSEREKLIANNDSLTLELQMAQKLSDDLSQQLDSVQSQSSNDFKDNSINTSIFILQTELSSEKIKCKDLEDELQQRKEKAHQMSKTISILEDSQKDLIKKNEALQMALDKISVEKDSLQSQNIKAENETKQNNLSIAQNENKNLTEALNKIALEMEATSSDISEESETKNKMIELIHHQSTILFEQEKLLNKQKDVIEQLTEENNSFRSQSVKSSIKKVKEDQINEIISQLQQFIQTRIQNEQDQHSLQQILNEDSTPALNRISHFIDELYGLSNKNNQNSESYNDDALKEEKKRYILYISNLVKFISLISDSANVQQWLIDSPPSDFRQQLLVQLARIDSFFRSHGLLLDEVVDETHEIDENSSDFTNFSERAKQVIEKYLDKNDPQESELISLIQQCTLANEILRKYGEGITTQSQQFISDMKQLRYDLQQSQEQLEETKEDAKIQIASANDEKEHIKEILSAIQTELRNQNGTSAIKCLNMISDGINDQASNDEEESNGKIENYISQLEHRLEEVENELKNTQYDMEKQKDEAKKIIQQLKQEKKNACKKAEQAIKEAENHIDEIASKVEELKTENEQIEKEREQLEISNHQLNETLKKQNIQIEEFNKLRLKDIAEVEKDTNEKMQQVIDDYEAKAKQQEDEKGKMKIQFDEQSKAIRCEMKQKIKELEAELDEQIQRNQDLKAHYEPLLENLRTSFKEAKKSESNAIDQKNIEVNNNKALKSELANLRIEMKMQNMKMNSFDEKLKRQKVLMETQSRMKLLSLQSQHQTEIEDINAKNSRQEHQILVNICGFFKEYIDFSAQICPEMIYSILDNVRHDLDDLHSHIMLEQKNQEFISDVQNTLKVSNLDDIIPSIEELQQLAKENEQYRQSIDEHKNEFKKIAKMAQVEQLSKEWESWARRLVSLITDNFSINKGPKQLQYVIEETIMNAIGQRQNWHRMETLRAEKALLLSGANKLKNHNRSPSLLSLMVVINCIRRMQKISGQLHCNVSGKTISGEIQPTSNTPKKNYPIVSFF